MDFILFNFFKSCFDPPAHPYFIILKIEWLYNIIYAQSDAPKKDILVQTAPTLT